MKHFKVKASRYAERYEITRENFERVTGCKEPFEQIKDTGRGISICNLSILFKSDTDYWLGSGNKEQAIW